MRKWTIEQREKQRALMLRLKPWTRSTGPRADAGKARSSRNALKHGGRSAPARQLIDALAAHARYRRALACGLKKPSNELLSGPARPASQHGADVLVGLVRAVDQWLRFSAARDGCADGPDSVCLRG